MAWKVKKKAPRERNKITLRPGLKVVSFSVSVLISCRTSTNPESPQERQAVKQHVCLAPGRTTVLVLMLYICKFGKILKVMIALICVSCLD